MALHGVDALWNQTQRLIVAFNHLHVDFFPFRRTLIENLRSQVLSTIYLREQNVFPSLPLLPLITFSGLPKATFLLSNNSVGVVVLEDTSLGAEVRHLIIIRSWCQLLANDNWLVVAATSLGEELSLLEEANEDDCQLSTPAALEEKNLDVCFL
jgi:hypothetical protein